MCPPLKLLHASKLLSSSPLWGFRESSRCCCDCSSSLLASKGAAIGRDNLATSASYHFLIWGSLKGTKSIGNLSIGINSWQWVVKQSFDIHIKNDAPVLINGQSICHSTIKAMVWQTVSLDSDSYFTFGILWASNAELSLISAWACWCESRLCWAAWTPHCACAWHGCTRMRWKSDWCVSCDIASVVKQCSNF